MTENNNTQHFIKQLAEREGVSEIKIKEIIIDSFNKSYCQGENARAELHFEFDSGLSVYRRYKIVEVINDPEKEITKDNKLLKEGQVKDNTFFLPLDIKNLSLSLNQEIKKRLRKDVEEISWKRQYDLYKPQQGEIIKGSIKSTQGKEYYSVDLGEGTGHWAKSEWTLREEPRLGQRFYLLIKEVREKSTEDTPQIILTRSDDLFIRKLLEQEIPQIKSGTVVVHGIIRLPGLASKILVGRGAAEIEKRINIDPVGTCIGEKCIRVQKISSLIQRTENIFFIGWTENKKTLFARLFSLSAESIRINIKKEGNWEVTAADQQTASLILQHEGKMLKKISNYLGINIHVRTLEEAEKDEVLENKGQALQEIGNYKNINVQIVEEIEK